MGNKISVIGYMNMYVLSDLKHMIDNGPGGKEVVYNGHAFTALFDNAPEYYSEGDGRLIMGNPQLVCFPPDVAGIKHGDILTVAGVTYKVDVVAPDANGATTIQVTRG